MAQIYLFTEEEKKAAEGFTAVNVAEAYASGAVKGGLIISNGEIVGSEADE